MRLIKRYSNRKLYDTEMRSYITLDGLAALVVEGEEIKVVDNDTEEDLTSVILSQILLERERTQRFLPSAVLSQLLRGGENLGRSLGKAARPRLSPLLPIPPALEQEIEKSLKFWLDLGQSGEEEILRLIESWIEKRRHNRTEPDNTNRRPVRISLDNFEEWGGDGVTAPPIPPRVLFSEALAKCLKASRELTTRLEDYTSSSKPAMQEEIEKLTEELTNTRNQIEQLLAAL
jgi:polyhydroxyalkanoate synthesis repressor PhaR